MTAIRMSPITQVVIEMMIAVVLLVFRDYVYTVANRTTPERRAHKRTSARVISPGSTGTTE